MHCNSSHFWPSDSVQNIFFSKRAAICKQALYWIEVIQVAFCSGSAEGANVKLAWEKIA